MKKIVFIENRYRTLFWVRMAELLEEEGYEVFFIVENHSFSPHRKNVYQIPYPAVNDLKSAEDRPEFVKIRHSDRALNYFRLGSSSHYGYYYDQIESILKVIEPDVVFGESTAFHELLTIEICKKMNILYLHPSSCRYPAGRFSFYRYDTLEPYSGSGEEWTQEEALQTIGGIVHRKIVPDYMKKKKVKLSSRLTRLKELVKLTVSYYKGEHYDTPAPWVKRCIEQERKRNIARWNLLAEKQTGKLDASGFKILYPLQMQPEANIDVWGRKYNNQLQLIRQLVGAAPEDVYLVVKPNPKSKYEVSSDLIDYAEKNERIIVIHHDVPMIQVFQKIDLIVTVTGTIAMECIWANKPVLTLIKTLHNNASNAVFLENTDDLQAWINRVRKKEFPIIDDRQKTEFLNLIVRTSFAGKPYEAGVREEGNLEKCKMAFKKVLDSL